MENVGGEDWQVVLSLFPKDWEKEAGESGAMARLRGFSSAEALMHTILLHVARGYSLRETVVQARAAKLASVSDVALLKRLRNAEGWLRTLCLGMLRDNGVAFPAANTTRRVRVVDGTLVKEPGKTGSQWRLLYSLQLPTLVCDFMDLTSDTGAGTGEALVRVPLEREDLLLADAGYCSVAGIDYTLRQGADVVVRVNPTNFPMCGPTGRKRSLLVRLGKLSKPGQIGEWKVFLPKERGWIEGRVCALRKSETAIQNAERKLRRKASKKQTTLRPETLEYAKYVIVFTTWKSAPAKQILEWYRVRWQIELAFKRMKSLAQLGHLPKYDDHSSRAWLYGKLFVALLAQKLMRTGREISPWGYPFSVSPAQ
jgi:Transposase DDE domain